MERDEVYVPKTRTDLDLPKEGDPALDYEEILGDTPIYTLYMLIRQQLLAFPAYLREFTHILICFLRLTWCQFSMYPAKKPTPSGPIISIVSL